MKSLKRPMTFFLALLPVYILGFSLFRWGYQKLTMQIESAQLAQVRLYADSIDSEFERIRNNCDEAEDMEKNYRYTYEIEKVLEKAIKKEYGK